MIANKWSKINDRGGRTSRMVAQPAKIMLLRQGGGILSVGLLCTLLMQGDCNCQIPFAPVNSREWLLVIGAMTFLPFGILLLVIAMVLQLLRTTTKESRFVGRDSNNQSGSPK
jgi:hypothetical protein